MPGTINKNFGEVLTYTDSFTSDYRPLQGGVSDLFRFNDSYTYSFHVKTVTYNEYIQYVESYDAIRDLFFSDQLNYVDSYEIGYNVNLTDTLIYFDSYTGISAPEFNEALHYVDSFNYSADRLIGLTDTFSFNDAFVGNTFSFIISAPNTFTRGNFRLDGLDLPPPEFGDKNTVDMNRIIRSGQDSGLVEIVDFPEWEPLQQFTYKFRLNELYKTALQQRLRARAGATVVLVDHWNRAYNVVVLNPNAEFVQDGRSMFTVELDLLCVT